MLPRKNSEVVRLRCVLVVTFACLGQFECSFADTVYVNPSSPLAIQTAIDSASSGDSILVLPGSYAEAIDTGGKEIFLISTGGASQTIVDAERSGSVIRLTGGGTVEGFTIRGGLAFAGGGIYVAGGNAATIRSNIIEDNIAGLIFDSGLGGGIFLEGSTSGVLVENNTIRGNIAGDEGGGVFDNGPFLFDVPNEIRTNLIVENACFVAGGGISAYEAIIEWNTVAANHSSHFGGGIFLRGGESRVSNNTILSNSVGNGLPNGAGIDVVGIPIVTNNLIVGNKQAGGAGSGAGIFCSPSARPTIGCNDMWGNDVDIISSCLMSEDSNIFLDPEFCAIEPLVTNNYFLQEDSPCSPSNPQNSCGLIGAHPSACGVVSVVQRSWGQLKSLYR